MTPANTVRGLYLYPWEIAMVPADIAFTPSWPMLAPRRTDVATLATIRPLSPRGDPQTMNHAMTRLIPVLAGALALAACSDHKTRPETPSGRTATTTTTTTTSAPATRSSTGTPASTPRSGSKKEAALPENTGIAACDEYLASYKSCHLAAGIYARDQIESRYELMRTSLLRQSQDADMRGQLGARCTSLATQLKEALHGKSCTDVPAPASTR